MGREAAGLLIKLIEHDKIEDTTIQLPVSFVERETTRSKE
jgi:LacI family transcriptional regulator